MQLLILLYCMVPSTKYTIDVLPENSSNTMMIVQWATRWNLETRHLKCTLPRWTGRHHACQNIRSTIWYTCNGEWCHLLLTNFHQLSKVLKTYCVIADSIHHIRTECWENTWNSIDPAKRRERVRTCLHPSLLENLMQMTVWRGPLSCFAEQKCSRYYTWITKGREGPCHYIASPALLDSTG